jgi:hypothetical protein
MTIQKEYLKTIKEAGQAIAEVCADNKEYLIYKLNDAITPKRFWSTIREISVKMISLEDEDAKYNPIALGEIIEIVKEHEENWKELRDLLVSYACIYTSSVKQHKNNES